MFVEVSINVPEEYELHVRCVVTESEIKQIVQFINDTLDSVSIEYATKEDLDNYDPDACEEPSDMTFE